MEGDSRNHKKKSINSLLDFSNFLQPTGVRRSICNDDETDRVLLDYGFNLLLPFGIILWIVLAPFIF